MDFRRKENLWASGRLLYGKVYDVPARLQPGGSGHAVVIEERAHLNHTGVEVKPGQVYRIDIDKKWWSLFTRGRVALDAQVGRTGTPFSVRAGENFEAPADGLLYVIGAHRSWSPFGRLHGEIRRVR